MRADSQQIQEPAPGPDRGRRMAALVTLLRGEAATRRVIPNRTQRRTGHPYQISRTSARDGYCGETNLVIASTPLSVYPPGHLLDCPGFGIWVSGFYT
jgi:hypothetical protein